MPDGWAIQDVNNTGFTLGVEALQGYGILAQLCPEEEHPQQQAGHFPMLVVAHLLAAAARTTTAVEELKKK